MTIAELKRELDELIASGTVTEDSKVFTSTYNEYGRIIHREFLSIGVEDSSPDGIAFVSIPS